MIDNNLLQLIAYMNNSAEISLIPEKFNCEPDIFVDNYRKAIYEHFQRELIIYSII